jgi:tetratricopeptide (TPR) repeat protein
MSDSPRIEELRRRVQGDPASIAFAALAEEFRRGGRFKEAVETSRAGLRHHPTYVSARVTLGRSLVELQEFEQAERELAFVLRSAPDNLAARRALGELCWQRLRFADALSHFKAALVLAPRDAELPGIITSLERELESERAAAAGPGSAESAAADVPAVEASAVAAPAAGLALPAMAPPAVAMTEAMTAEAGADGDTLRMPAGTVLTAAAVPGEVAAAHAMSAEAVPAGAGKSLSGAAAIAALERFYRSIVRARDANPPATRVSGV